MTAYYNEHDRKAAAWLSELGKADLIPPGTIDTRDIQEVTADDVRGFSDRFDPRGEMDRVEKTALYALMCDLADRDEKLWRREPKP